MCMLKNRFKQMDRKLINTQEHTVGCTFSSFLNRRLHYYQTKILFNRLSNTFAHYVPNIVITVCRTFREKPSPSAFIKHLLNKKKQHLNEYMGPILQGWLCADH